ncbi:MAG: hypothetical protein AB1716_10880 [Planctomycetota bacterium]
MDSTGTTGLAARYGHGAAYDAARQRTVIYGGFFYPNGPMYGDTREWDGSAWTVAFSDSPSRRYGHRLAYDAARDKTVLFGGYDYAGNWFADTWTWDGARWAHPAVSGPPARYMHHQVYDAARDVVVLFGGGTSTMLDDTWEWNGAAWAQRAGSGPPARGAGGMAYDSGRQVSVLFGGWSGAAHLADTWEWNGTAWTQRAGAGPPPRRHTALAYDAHRARTVLFGGIGDGETHFGDTWEWDGGNWVEQLVAGPGARFAMALYYDAPRQVVVLMGGATTNQYLADEWEWNGEAWTRRDIATTPHGRCYHATAYDTVRQTGVLCAGYFNDGSNRLLSDTWALHNTSTSYVRQGLPARQTALAREPKTLSVSVQATGTPHYQWRKDGTPLAENPPRVTGTQTATLALDPVEYGDDGYYDVLITDDCGTMGSAAGRLVVPPPGDLNCDGDVTFDDINPFVLALSNPAGYQQQFPDCRLLQGDCNGDGLVNFDDINPFVALLSGAP